MHVWHVTAGSVVLGKIKAVVDRFICSSLKLASVLVMCFGGVALGAGLKRRGGTFGLILFGLLKLN